MNQVMVALLRGINVGGNAKVEMSRLKLVCERHGCTEVATFINSGNVMFRTAQTGDLRVILESAIAQEFGLAVPVVVRTREQIATLLSEVPLSWVNDDLMRCDILFLWPEIDRPDILKLIPHRPEIEDLVYFPGTVVWRVDRARVRQGQVPKMIGSDTYKHLTMRNINTVRKLDELMQAYK